MSKVLPSQLVEAIDSLFGANPKELDGRAVTRMSTVPRFTRSWLSSTKCRES